MEKAIRDVVASNLTIVDQMLLVRKEIDDTFRWKIEPQTDLETLHRAATYAALVLFDRHVDEGKNELLHTKVFAIVMARCCRSHADHLFTYDHGAYVDELIFFMFVRGWDSRVDHSAKNI